MKQDSVSQPCCRQTCLQTGLNNQSVGWETTDRECTQKKCMHPYEFLDIKARYNNEHDGTAPAGQGRNTYKHALAKPKPSCSCDIRKGGDFQSHGPERGLWCTGISVLRFDQKRPTDAHLSRMAGQRHQKAGPRLFSRGEETKFCRVAGLKASVVASHLQAPPLECPAVPRWRQSCCSRPARPAAPAKAASRAACPSAQAAFQRPCACARH